MIRTATFPRDDKGRYLSKSEAVRQGWMFRPATPGRPAIWAFLPHITAPVEDEESQRRSLLDRLIDRMTP